MAIMKPSMVSTSPVWPYGGISSRSQVGPAMLPPPCSL